MRSLYILCCIVLLSTVANAQIGSAAPWENAPATAAGRKKPSPAPSDPSPQDVPLDGGLGLLLAAGALYGGRAYKNQKKANAKAA